MTLAWPFRLQASGGFSLILCILLNTPKEENFVICFTDSIKQILCS